MTGAAGVGFTPHVITVNVGEVKFVQLFVCFFNFLFGKIYCCLFLSMLCCSTKHAINLLNVLGSVSPRCYMYVVHHVSAL